MLLIAVVVAPDPVRGQVEDLPVQDVEAETQEHIGRMALDRRKVIGFEPLRGSWADRTAEKLGNSREHIAQIIRREGFCVQAIVLEPAVQRVLHRALALPGGCLVMNDEQHGLHPLHREHLADAFGLPVLEDQPITHDPDAQPLSHGRSRVGRWR